LNFAFSQIESFTIIWLLTLKLLVIAGIMNDGMKLVAEDKIKLHS